MEVNERLERLREIMQKRPVTFGISLLELPDHPIPLYVLELEEHLRWLIENDGLLKCLNEVLQENVERDALVKELAEMIHALLRFNPGGPRPAGLNALLERAESKRNGAE